METKRPLETPPTAFLITGSPGRTRTSDQVVNSHPLCRLSYRGTGRSAWDLHRDDDRHRFGINGGPIIPTHLDFGNPKSAIGFQAEAAKSGGTMGSSRPLQLAPPLQGFEQGDLVGVFQGTADGQPMRQPCHFHRRGFENLGEVHRRGLPLEIRVGG